jgi:tripartite ATP-independent transporter DctM subunit
MSSVTFAVFGLMFLFLASGLWIGLALLGIGIAGLAIFKDMPVDRLLGQLAWNSTSSAELIALPLFVLMGELLFHTRLSSALFEGLAPWTRRLPGRLFHVNVIGSTLFAAVSGSSAATTATVGRISLSELAGRGYDRDLAMGSLAGAGTLGFLIPPSIVMIIYGVLADTSILQLFMAGVVPGLTLAGMFAAYIMIRCALQPDLVPHDNGGVTRLFDSLMKIMPVIALIIGILGSIYAGIATPTEAATVGVIGALAIGIAQKTLNWQTFVAACHGTIRMISMIGLIMIGASFLSVAIGFLGLPRQLSGFVSTLELSPLAIIIALLVIYILLGMLIDGLSMIVMTLPFALPLIQLAGYDRLWFGIFIVIAVEMAQITPPVGFNLYVIHGLTGEPIARIARAALPFFFIMVGFVFLLAAFPALVSWLPATMAKVN